MRKAIVLCLLSAVLLILSFPSFNIEVFSWFGFVPLFFALRNKSPLKAFSLAYLTGIIFWSGTIYWLVHVTLTGLIFLVLYLAIYFGIFGLIVSRFTRYAVPGTPYQTIINFLSIPSLWVLLEYIRSFLFTGFPWIPLGYSQYLNLPAIQIADITGVWGVSFVVMMVNAGLYTALNTPQGDTGLSNKAGCCQLSVFDRIKKLGLPLLCFVLVLIYGYVRLSELPYSVREKRVPSGVEGRGTTLKISVIQGNIPQEMKWERQAAEYIINKYVSFSSMVVTQNPDLVIWPEAAFPLILKKQNNYAALSDWLRKFTLPLLTGVVTADEDRYYNSALLIGEKGRVLNKYDKVHLVPFGEYIPLRAILGFLETVVPIGDFVAGKEYTIFEFSPGQNRHSAHFGVLICFEDVFPGLSRRFVRNGADFLVNMTNDAWFGKTSSAYQHLSASVFRAVENRVYLVRAANTGISGFLGPSGRIISLVQDRDGNNLFISGVKTEIIDTDKKNLSFYCRYGDVFVAGCIVMVLCSIVWLRKNIQYKVKA